MKAMFKRYCKVLELRDVPELIAEYKRLHERGGAWPEIGQGIRQVGIIDMEIYIRGTTLFMIMDTAADFDHDKAMAELGKLPRQAEWEALMSKFQKTSRDASAAQKWQLVERIFKLGEKHPERATDGYLEGTDV